MPVIILALIIGGFIFIKIYNSPKEKLARQLSKGKNEAQVKTIRYFLETTFGPKWKTDEEYEGYLENELNFGVEQAIEKLGLDESEVSEIPPVRLDGYIFDKKSLSKRDKQRKWISSAYHVTWLLFSSKQVFVYRKENYVDENRSNISTLEYFYKDVTAFRTAQESYEVIDRITEQKFDVNADIFKIIVPGDDLKVIIENDPSFEQSIKGMQQLLREKKG